LWKRVVEEEKIVGKLGRLFWILVLINVLYQVLIAFEGLYPLIDGMLLGAIKWLALLSV